MSKSINNGEKNRDVAKLLFWGSAAALAYTYVGYPALAGLVSRYKTRPVRRQIGYEPTVSLIITAYNEERDLPAKLNNTLGLDYPPEKLEIIVASDCSSDATDDIVRAFAERNNNPFRTRLHRQPQRGGKTAAQNAAVELAHGEIILFSDATTLYQPDVLRALLPNFADPEVGCVAGKLLYVDPAQSGVGSGAKSYWGYETYLKTCESRIGSLIGVSGCLYALRRAAYVPLPPEACSDFVIATVMVEQNLRTIFEPEAFCTEETNRRPDRELKMRVRIITQTFTDLWQHRAMLNPLRSGFYAIQLLSHKVLRYLAPMFLIGAWISSVKLARNSHWYLSVSWLQNAFYALAALGFWKARQGDKAKPKSKIERIATLPFYFVLTNYASLLAIFQWLRGERYARWEPIRDNSQNDSESNPPSTAEPGARRD